MAPRNRKPKETVSSLIEAMRFIACAQLPQGNAFQTHVVLSNGWATAFNGTIAAGMPIDEDIGACPNSKLFYEALQRCGQGFAIIQNDQTSLTIKKEPFDVIIPCVPFDIMQRVQPDTQAGVLNDEVVKAMEAVLFLADDDPNLNGKYSVNMRRNSVIATNGRMMLEYWHGIDLPSVLLPKVAIEAVSKARKPVAGIGVSNNTVTFYFADSSWIRSQLMTGTPAPFERILDKDRPCAIQDVPTLFFEGVRAIMPFADSMGMVIFTPSGLATHDDAKTGARFQLDGIPQGPRYNGNYLLKLEPYIKQMDFIGVDGIGYFFGGSNVRGCIAGIAPPVREIRTSITLPDNSTSQEVAEAFAGLRKLPPPKLEWWEKFVPISDDDIPF